MLTRQEELNTAHELQENFSRLNSDLPTILNDLQISIVKKIDNSHL